MRKKVDTETLRIQDTKYLQNSEEKWKNSEAKFNEIISNLDIIFKKIKKHEDDILGLSDNVYDYSFKEMAASFDERVDNRLVLLKQQIKELNQQIQTMNKNYLQENSSNILLSNIQKMVDLKLDTYANSIDQKLIHIAHNKSDKLEVPLETVDGKKIIYKAGDEVINPNRIQPLINGSFKLKKKCKYQGNCENLHCNYDHWGVNELIGASRNRYINRKENCVKEDVSQKKCKYDNTCPEAKCPYFHTKKICGGFKTCKKRECQRRHHPDRILKTNNSQRGKNQRNSLNKTHLSNCLIEHQPLNSTTSYQFPNAKHGPNYGETFRHQELDASKCNDNIFQYPEYKSPFNQIYSTYSPIRKFNNQGQSYHPPPGNSNFYGEGSITNLDSFPPNPCYQYQPMPFYTYPNHYYGCSIPFRFY